MSHRPLPELLVVTPVRDGEALLGDTMRSVLGQTAVAQGRVGLRYVIADGASSDATVQIASATAKEHPAGGVVEIRSRPDTGLYDALANVWGELDQPPHLMGWLNAGDLWEPMAIDTVLDVIAEHDAPWICGQRVLYDTQGLMTSTEVPFRFRQRLLASGAYGGVLPHVQQESTFWRGSLLDTVDLDRLRTMRVAGDQYLWACFASRCEPTIVEAVLGGHRVHDDQLSADRAGYRAEALTVVRRPSAMDRLVAMADRPLWQLSPGAKKRLNPRQLLRRDHRNGRWV